MKKIFFFLLMIAPAYCFAQADTLKNKQKEEFCEVLVRHYASGYELKINNKDEDFDKIDWLKDADNKKRKFKSTVGVLNYMSQYGWIPVTTFTEVTRGNSDDMHFVFKRPLTQ
ncbi:hypothetical protein [Mucilaginibacter sp. KACC 22063]|uniref:hypothetical protein n=1 Tax=Mucilaginibacter sp. KACC 22063 TaxID=3025666 RepID=UPI002366A17F|nr:hypothetical protein [Mucilaginibacter sp. KACC 22063]WDF56401.1 hypothetical protein PQ461_04965 [Mucilaginibacter sp. KACC 22063]